MVYRIGSYKVVIVLVTLCVRKSYLCLHIKGCGTKHLAHLSKKKKKRLAWNTNFVCMNYNGSQTIQKNLDYSNLNFNYF